MGKVYQEPRWYGDTSLTPAELLYLKEVSVSADNYYRMMNEIRQIVIPSLTRQPDSMKLKSYVSVIEENFIISTKLRDWAKGNKTLLRFPLNHDELLTATDLSIEGKKKCVLLKSQYLDIARRTSLLASSQSHENPIDFAEKSVEEVYIFLIDGMNAINFDTGEVSQEKLDKIKY